MKLIELYKFTLGSEEWNYTSGNESVIYDGDTYTTKPLGRGNVESRNELSRASLEVTIDILDSLAQRLLTVFTEQVMTLTIYTLDQEDLSVSITWKGRMSNVRPLENKLTMSLESVFTSLRRPGLRARFQKPCRHVLYSTRGCKLDPEDFAVVGQLESVDSNVLEVPEAAAEADGYYLGGMVRAPDDLLGFITTHSGSTLTLERPFDSLITARAAAGYGRNYGNYWGGVKVLLYPGCDLLKSTCLNKFNNLDRFGGFPWIPFRNPMDGSSIV